VKIGHLDSLRGLAAVLVVFSHFINAFYPFAVFNSTDVLFDKLAKYTQISPIEPLFHQTPLAFFAAGHFAVCLFFILSGYVLSYKHLGRNGIRIRILAASLKRPIRLGGVVLLTIVLSYLFMRFNVYYNQQAAKLTTSIPWFDVYWQNTPSFLTFLSDLILHPFSRGLIYSAPLWTIQTELYGSYLVFAYLFFLSNFKHRYLAIALLVFLFRNSLYLGFLLGIITAEIEKKFQIKSSKSLNQFLLAILPIGIIIGSYPTYVEPAKTGAFYSGFPTEFQRLGGGGYSILGALILFVCVLFCSSIHGVLNRKFFNYIGSISYPLYSLHFILLGSISAALYCVLANLSIHHHLAVVLTLLISFPVMIASAHLANRWIDTRAIQMANWVGDRCEKLLLQKLNSRSSSSS
jgi:peptidoglycan/LPS O-acetylase OafA/YrhL